MSNIPELERKEILARRTMEVHRLRAENERLREALQRLHDRYKSMYNCTYFNPKCDMCVAKAALAGEKQP